MLYPGPLPQENCKFGGGEWLRTTVDSESQRIYSPRPFSLSEKAPPDLERLAEGLEPRPADSL